MLIGLCGTTCSGKHVVASYLTRSYGFIPISYAPQDNKETKETNGIRANSAGEETTFATIEALLTFVTKRWQRNYVLASITHEDLLEALSKRPFFLLVSIDAPIRLRWERLLSSKSHAAPTHFEEFVAQSDEEMYHPTHGLARLMTEAGVKLINSAERLEVLYQAVDRLNLLDEGRLRPSWDEYFMQLASLAAKRSNCMKRRVGAVLVREKRVVSTGYNGTPRGLRNCNMGGCARCNDGLGTGAALATCLCLHAEENALLEAGRERIREGTILYCDTCPCLTCSIKITQVGISEVVYSQGYSMDRETASILQEGGVKLRQFSPPRRGLVCLGDS